MTAREAEGRGTAFDDGGASLTSIFEGHAARHPDRLAVVSGDCRLTYGELNRRANQLAHRLRARGVLRRPHGQSVHGVEFEGGVWKVEAETADGTDVELKMDPNDGHIMGSEADKVQN